MVKFPLLAKRKHPAAVALGRKVGSGQATKPKGLATLSRERRAKIARAASRLDPPKRKRRTSVRKKIPAGSIFQKMYTDRDGKSRRTHTLYLKYYSRGKPIVISAETEDYDEALATLRQKLAQAAVQVDYTEHPERVRMSQLFDLLLEFYGKHERRSTYDVECKIKSRLRPWWGKIKAQAVGSALVDRYVRWRRSAKPKPQNASINRDLAYIRRALKLGAQQDPPLVLRVPHFEMLPESDPREGTLPHEKYKAVRDALPGYARIALVIAYHTGARKGEIRSVRKDQIDLKAGRINLPGRTTKNGKPRYLPIYGDLAVELDMAITAGAKDCPYLIQQDGKPVFDWKKAWATACKAAGVAGTLFHDLRRTALTNMIEAGLSEKEAMEISGHRTRSVFDRYHIVSDRRLKEMAGKLEVHLKAKDEKRPAQPAVGFRPN
jgi:integrase